MPRSFPYLLGVAVAAAVFGGAPAQAATQGARETGSTTVRAKLKFFDGQGGEVPVWTNLSLTVSRNDQLIMNDEPLPAAVATSYFTAPKLLALDLDDDSDPELLLDVFTAGYSCCRRSLILRFNGQSYDREIVEWSTDGYRLGNVGGGASPEFLTDDGRFPRLYGASGARGPLRILRLVDGRLRDVTADLPERLRKDARVHASALRKARRQRADTRPALAAYVVDLARLGQIGTARRAIQRAASRRELRTTQSGFSRRIDARMIAWGYANRPLLSGVATPVAASR